MQLLISVFVVLGISSPALAASGNPHGYSVEVMSDHEADVLDGSRVLVRRLHCQNGIQSDGTYKVNCPKSMNVDAEFQSVLDYDSSQDQWGSAPFTGFLAMPGEAALDMGCSAAGTGPGNSPSFQLFGCSSDLAVP
jgi:hypothetical protein